MDTKRITVHFRDINGKRFSVVWEDLDDFQLFDWDENANENNEILMVEWGQHCIYSALGNVSITMEDLVGFFA